MTTSATDHREGPLSETVRRLLQNARDSAESEPPVAQAEPRLSELRRRLLLSETGIPERFRSATFQDFARHQGNQEAVRAAEALAQNPLAGGRLATKGLYLHGPIGTGKTLIACAAGTALALRGVTVLFRVMPDLLGEIRATYSDETPENEASLIRRYTTCDLLILDDVGQEQPTDWARDRFFTIVNRRYNALRPVLVTTNKHPNELDALFGEAIMSRLIELCAVKRVDGANYRLRRTP